MRKLPRMLVAAALVTALGAPPVARADSDPASDTLLLQDVFVPIQPPMPPAYASAIRSMAASTKKAGFPLKVAIIATANDLGLVPQLFGKPQGYAPYLGREIDFQRKNSLLVVMPAGYGTNDVLPKVAASVSNLPAPGASLESIGKGTLTAMARMSAAAGHPVPVPKVKSSGGGSGGSTSPAVIFGVPVLFLALAGGLMALRRRQTPPQPAAPGEGERTGEKETAAP
ncbi:MAG: hypothetical protein ACJ768_05600 [Gaiellaceae bacterium]